MNNNTKNNTFDDISEMVENAAKDTAPASPDELAQAMRDMAASADEEKTVTPWLIRYRTLPSYALNVERDCSDVYHNALTDAIIAITYGNYGSIEYKGYKIYYNDTPHLSSISIKDGHKEYRYYAEFRCDALRSVFYEEYHSEHERKGFLSPENNLFKKTLSLLDKVIAELDDGTWIKEKKTLNIYDFRDYSPDNLRLKRIDQDERDKDAANTLTFLIQDAISRTKGYVFSEDDFEIFSDVIRRMVFFADYGKRNYLVGLQGFIMFEWKPKTKRNRYIWLCMNEFGQGDLPDILLDNCTIYYFLDDPKGWEAIAYLLPIMALAEMCQDYDPDSVKNNMLRVFNLIPDIGYRERIEKLIAQDRSKAEQRNFKYD